MSTEQALIDDSDVDHESDIAIIGMVGRFPDADDVGEFWENLKNGVESVKPLSHDIISKGSLNSYLENNSEFVYAEASLDKEMVKMFDADFFNISPREAEIMDPQHRLFLEACWELFEVSGYSMEHYSGQVGVFGSAAYSGYFENISHDLLREVGVFQTQLANDKDFLATRVSYKMGFTGPSINVNTLCSSAAVCIHMARESLLNYQSDFALAGGVNISFTTAGTSYYHEGGIGADEGHCRAYDDNASGTVAGNGLGIIAMKRLVDAQADGDTIHAVIKGTAVNNDGANKASYTAPSSEGQAEVISECIAVSDVDPETISYIDGHGTGTYIGDPIEIAGLTKAYRRYTNKTQYCAIGSVKTNIGHLVTAGGVASLIKTVLSLKNKMIPPSLNFEKPNSKIDFANSPFFVNDKLTSWDAAEYPRRAAVSSFGIGGTNVHTILEEAPDSPVCEEPHSDQLILLSARSEAALINMKENLHEYLESDPGVSLRDISYTLKIGRSSFEHRFAVVCQSVAELKVKLKAPNNSGGIYHQHKKSERPLCFMFPGQGSQSQNMAAAIYKNEMAFKTAMDICAEHILQREHIDIRELIYSNEQLSPCPLEETLNAQLALFCTEYALCKLWESRGILPAAMIGHSIGEYVAACISGVFSLEDALIIVAERGKVMSAQPAGDMIAVSIGEGSVSQYLCAGVDIAAVNGPNAIVLSGTSSAISQVAENLKNANIGVSVLRTSHAFHSHMMNDAGLAFQQKFEGIELSEPKIPFISNVSGDWIKPEQATNPEYWVSHLTNKVLFNEGLETLAVDTSLALLEVGPGTTLASLSKMTSHDPSLIISSLPRSQQAENDMQAMEVALGALWSVGIMPDWDAVYAQEQCRRIPLPTYPFERKRYWASEETQEVGQSYKADVSLTEISDLADQCSLSDEFLTGNIHINLKFPNNLVAQDQDKINTIVSLRNQIEELCSNLESADIVEVDVTPVGLVKDPLTERSTTEVISEDTKEVGFRPLLDTEIVEPSNDMERQLVEIWRRALGVTPIGIHDNFFELGGHSLIASTMANNLSQQYKVNLDLRELLEKPTVAHLAELIEAKKWVLENTEDAVEEISEGSMDTLIL